MYTLNFNSSETAPEEFQFPKTRRLFKSTFVATTVAACTAASLLLIIAFPISPINLKEELEPGKSSCASRRHCHKISSSYHKPPSPYLLSMLRDYEQRHKRCEPLSESFNRSFFQKQNYSTKSHQTSHVVDDDDCSYVVFTRPTNGLGNRMLSMSSAFLYALLTNRVLLVDFGPDMTHLFSEPVPNSTWLFPEDFRFGNRIYGSKVDDFGSLMKKKNNNYTDPVLVNISSSFLHVNLGYGYDDYDKLFYSNGVQDGLQKVAWLILKSDQYFVPYLFLMSGFRAKLDRMFPDKEAVFHHLGRYLFTPSDQAWGLIARFYDAYLEKADERIGLQIRVLDSKASPTALVLKQVLRCAQKEAQILPPLATKQNETATKKLVSKKTSYHKAVLVASLSSEFYIELKDMFWKRASASTGSDEEVAVGFHQASREEVQRSNDGSHNMMAWVDIYLLSLCDVLVTSGWSTFGYVAQGLGGLRPWILQIPDTKYGGGDTLWGQACRRAVSMEPCFHFPPSYDDNKVGVRVDGSSTVVHCEDVGGGLKLVNL
ncbi:unnamed protein product [Linum tenue]|uniref:Fucosyltransferase n=2 Tax=Linum tenue TaxID=586396 RepID=A0AAV0KGT5_9ROSI|nr:unnamed protein product [Linum tenue]